MANAFLQGVQVGNQTKQEDRRAKQVRLTNLIKGFEQGNGGEYEPNARGQAMFDGQEAAMQQQLAVLQSQNEAIQAVQNTESMTKATTQLAMGNVSEAGRIVNTNPVLKQQLQEQFGVSAVHPIDWENDLRLFEGTGVNITPEMLADPKVKAALNSSFFKTVGPDGKQKIGNTQQLIDSTGYMQYASKEDRDGIFARVNKISEILSGHIKTPEEERLEATKMEANQHNANISNSLAEVTQEYYDSILGRDDIGPEEKLKIIQGVRGKSPDDIKAQIQAEKLRKAQAEANIATTTQDDVIAKKKAEAESAKAKAEDSRPYEGEAEFISNIRNPEKIPFSDDNLRIASKLQGKKTLTAERGKEVNGRFSMAKSFDNFTRKFMTADINRDALAKIGTTMDKLMKPGMTGQDQERVLNSIEIDTELRALISEYVKFMSGAAVTTEEFNRYNDIVQSGVWSSRESANEALRSFTNYLRRSAKDRIDSMTDIPHDYLIKRNDYENWSKSNPEIARTQAKSTPSSSNVFNKFRR